MYSTIETGSKYSKSYAVYIKESEKIISPFHDISPNINEESTTIRVFNEIPRFENAKFEMSKSNKMNPIMQDIKKEKPRFVANIFPYKGYIWNYGAVPQTWENPNILDEHTKAVGDNDPIDVIEIGQKTKKIGEVYEAKVLGCLALLDDNECDWKILVVDINDINAKKLNNLNDVELVCPHLLENTTKWFRDYKKADGKQENKFALDGKFMDSNFAMKIIMGAHEEWKKMMRDGKANEISTINTTMINSKYHTDDFTLEGSKSEDSELPENINDFFYC